MNLGFVFGYGFRPFFFLAAAWGALAVPLWLLAYAGVAGAVTAHADRYWHAHELVYGYAAAAIGGFLLTAIPNWTGRKPVGGWLLGGLVALWLVGRLGMCVGQGTGWVVAAVDLAFVPALMAVAAREIVGGRNWRNLVVLIFLGLLAGANVWYHATLLAGAAPSPALRLAIATLVMLIVFIGGRITPGFTRNWLVKQGIRRLPPEFGMMDRLALAGTAPALVSWVIEPAAAVTGGLAAAAATLLGLRLARWRGLAARVEPLLLVLHAGYAFVPIGFLLVAAHAFGALPTPDAALHAWTAGAVGTMTVAVMTRATLGHSGRALVATPGTVLIYGAVVLGAALRIIAPLVPAAFLPLLQAGGVAWAAGLAAYVAVYGPILLGLDAGRRQPTPSISPRS